MTKKESVIRASYEILKHYRHSGVATFIFRSKLAERLQEYNHEIIRDLEEMMIEYEWVLRDKKSRLLVPTRKLISTVEYRINHINTDSRLKIQTKTFNVNGI